MSIPRFWNSLDGARRNASCAAFGRPRLSRLVAWFAIAAVAMTTTTGIGVGGDRASAAPGNAPSVSLIGDSTMQAMGLYSSGGDILAIVGDSYHLTYDSASCRRLVVPSCSSRPPLSVLPLMKSTLQGRLGDAMVVMAGYDDHSLVGAADQIMAEAAAQGVVRVLWLNYPTFSNYFLPGGTPANDLYSKHNAELAAAASVHPSLQVLDWNAHSANRSGWFTSDGIHLTRVGAIALSTFIKESLDAQPAIDPCHVESALTGTLESGEGTVTVPLDRSGFIPLSPRRVLDTRDIALGGVAGKLGANRTVSVDLSAVIPADASAAVLSVTAVDACLPGFLTVFACGPRPATSNLNFEVARTTAAMAVTSMTGATVCVFSSAATDVVVDLVGAFSPSADLFHPMTPTRWVDTRGAAVQLPQITGIRATGAETSVVLRGEGGIPSDATAVWLNLTVADPESPTVLSAYPGPCGSPPLSSNVNARPQHSTAVAVMVGLGPDGTVCVRTYTGRSHLVIDVAGWFGPGPGGLAYRPTIPARLLDTRDQGAAPSAATHQVAVPAVSVLNVAAVDASGLGYVTARPCAAGQVSSLINTSPGQDTANLAAVAPDTAGHVCVRASVVSHLIVDQVAVFAP